MDDQTPQAPGARHGQAPPEVTTDPAPLPLQLTAVHLRVRQSAPPARYHESSLIGALQRRGLGRPSTYATTLGLLCERQLARRNENGELRPTWQGLAIWALLGEERGLIGPAQQAALETALDQIQRSERRRSDVLRELYSGQGGVLATHAALHRAAPPPLHLPALAGTGLHVTVSPAGVFVCDGAGHSALLPEMEPHELTAEAARQALDSPGAVSLRSARENRSRGLKSAQAPRVLGTHPQWGTPITLRTSASGRYLEAHDGQESRRATIPETEDASTLSPARAALLLSLNRSLGLAHDLGELSGLPVRTGLGRYGPYVRCGARHRPISEDDAMTLSLDEALKLLREPPRKGSATMSTHARLRRDGARRGAGDA